MLQKIFSVRDNAVYEYKGLITYKTVSEALRMFRQMLKQMAEEDREDYDLHQLGEINTETGQIGWITEKTEGVITICEGRNYENIAKTAKTYREMEEI
jgi:hypothetical protein